LEVLDGQRLVELGRPKQRTLLAVLALLDLPRWLRRASGVDRRWLRWPRQYLP
jgi:hypothetical protein